MNGCWESGVDAVLWLQGHFAFLQPLMRVLSFLGSTEFLLLLGLTVFWCVDRKTGVRLGILLVTGAAVGSVLKLAFHLPRPYWCDIRVQPLAGEINYGMPSIHALYAWAIAPWLGGRIRRGWGFALGALLAAGISVSRMMLGVHFPGDVLAGFAAGVLIWFGVEAVIRFLGPLLLRAGILVQGAAAAAASAALLLAQAVILGWIESAADPAAWAENAARINLILPRSPDNIVSLAGLILGMGTGLACQIRWAPFSPQGGIGNRLLRFLLGLSVAMLLWGGLAFLGKDVGPLLDSTLRYLRYALIGFWLIFAAPRLFLQGKLADRAPQA